MKMKTKLTLIGSIAAITASPLALADKAAPVKAEAPEVQEAEPEVVICLEAPDKGEVVEGETGDGEVTVEEGVVEVGEAEVDPAVCEVADGEAVPIDWVKRGGGDNPEIFQNMAGGEAPVFKGETAAGKELGQDEKASAIEAQDAAAPQIKREKKGPVALVKKGRVFLR